MTRKTPLTRRQPLRRKTRIKPVSPKQAGRLAIYRKMKFARIEDLCKKHGVPIDEYTKKKVWVEFEFHHPCGRIGKNLFDFVLIAPETHRWIHQHPKLARGRGWLK